MAYLGPWHPIVVGEVMSLNLGATPRLTKDATKNLSFVNFQDS